MISLDRLEQTQTLLILFSIGCGSGLGSATVSSPVHTRTADQQMLFIPAGVYVVGSTQEERERAYRDYQRTAGSDTARKHRWFERERARQRTPLPAFSIDHALVTNQSYAEFVRATGRLAPNIDHAAWKRQGFIQDYNTQVKRYRWRRNKPPKGRNDHPVVLVTWDDANAYCTWRGQIVGQSRRLPTAAEYEVAARGKQGLNYPWGKSFDPTQLNNGITGPLDTTPVSAFASGASPFGMLDAAGNVFQWTATPWPHRNGAMTVKGSAWDDYAGLGRGAAQHGRRSWVRHVLVGFRCAGPYWVR